MGDSREGLRKEALVGGSVMTNRAALQSPPRISHTLQIPPESPALCIAGVPELPEAPAITLSPTKSRCFVGWL